MVAFIALARLAQRAPSRGVTIGAALGAVAVLWLFANLGTSDALEHETGVSGVSPATVDPATGDTFLTVHGNGPFTIIFTVTNTSRLPLTLVGLVPISFEEVYDPPIAPRLVALGRLHEHVRDRGRGSIRPDAGRAGGEHRPGGPGLRRFVCAPRPVVGGRSRLHRDRLVQCRLRPTDDSAYPDDRPQRPDPHLGTPNCP